MTKPQLKALFEKVEAWPEERQEQVVRVLEELGAQAENRYTLSDEQVAEVERRLADPTIKFMTLAEARARLSRLGA